MGKKNRRKAAKAAAAAAAAGNANSSMGGKQLILGPRPDGITCTNENPYACAVCSRAYSMKNHEGIRQLNICCGTMVCTDCLSYERCCFCKMPWYQSTLASYAKKRSKEGFAWAHRFLGSLHQAGMPPYVPQSDEEAFRLFEKAAEQDHPDSCIWYVARLIAGFGCNRDLEKACVTFEKAIRLPFQYDYKEVLLTGNNLATALFGNGEIEKGHSVLSAMEMFADKAGGEALGVMSVFYDRVEDFEGFWRVNKKASESPDACPFSALSGALNTDNFCLARMWYGVSSKVELGNDEVLGKSRKSLLKSTHEALCRLRQKCAWCGISLDRSNRKTCKGCKAYCYCSEACQEAQWNAKEDDHKSECRKAMEVKKKTIALMKK